MHQFLSAHTVFEGTRQGGASRHLGEPTARLLWMEAGSHPSVSSCDPRYAGWCWDQGCVGEGWGGYTITSRTACSSLPNDGLDACLGSSSCCRVNLFESISCFTAFLHTCLKLFPQCCISGREIIDNIWKGSLKKDIKGDRTNTHLMVTRTNN